MENNFEFRGMPIGSNQMVHGYVFEDVPKYGNRHLSYIIRGQFVPALTMPASNFIEVKPETVGQRTGLKDSNDTPIYTGDIVNFTYWWFDGQERETDLTGVIVYDSELLSYALDGIKNEEWIRHIGGEKGDSDRCAFAFFRCENDNFKVIGNIFQNPELIK